MSDNVTLTWFEIKHIKPVTNDDSVNNNNHDGNNNQDDNKHSPLATTAEKYLNQKEEKPRKERILPSQKISQGRFSTTQSQSFQIIYKRMQKKIFKYCILNPNNVNRVRNLVNLLMNLMVQSTLILY